MLSQLDEARYVVFLDRVNAPSLADILKTTPNMHEHAVVDKILHPLSNALQAFKNHRLIHGNINTRTIYFDNTVILGDCISAPCGYFQPYLYEPIERLMADDHGRGHGDMKTDIYATGVLAYEMIFGLSHLQGMSKADFISHIFNTGTYQTFVRGRELSDSMADFFRGVLCDNRAERWDFDQLQAWLAGKRYNIVVPPPPKEATRALMFIEKEFYNQRALAHALHQNWRTGLKELHQLRIDRWVEVSMHRTELADRIERVTRSAGSASSDRANNDVMTRLLSLLDPAGPLRTNFISVRPEGIGLMLLESYQENMQTELQDLRYIIESDLANYWSLLREEAKPPYLSKLLFRLQRLRQYISMKGVGFGIERCIYDLNPSLACQSELVRALTPLTLKDVLLALDRVAPKAGATTSFVDRHLAAFCMSKLDIAKEMRINDLEAIPSLTKNKELITLRILVRAQQRYDKLQLVGLATWAAMRVEKMIDEIHNRSLRKKLKRKLRAAASTGYLSEVLGVLINRDVVNKDFEGFGRAAIVHARNRRAIEQLRSTKYINQTAEDIGGRIGSVIAYVALTISAYLAIASFLRW
jgi:hypothetical protein